MSAEHPPPARGAIPPGVVASSHGGPQIPVLRGVIRVLTVLAVLSLVVPGRAGDALATAAVAILVATPLGRAAWLIGCWAREADRRFVLTGIGLLAVVGAGAVLGILGVGG